MTVIRCPQWSSAYPDRKKCGVDVPPRQRIFSTFSHTHKVGNNGINANFVFPYICGFLLYLYLKMLVKMKLDISW